MFKLTRSNHAEVHEYSWKIYFLPANINTRSISTKHTQISKELSAYSEINIRVDYE